MSQVTGFDEGRRVYSYCMSGPWHTTSPWHYMYSSTEFQNWESLRWLGSYCDSADIQIEQGQHLISYR